MLAFGHAGPRRSARRLVRWIAPAPPVVQFIADLQRLGERLLLVR